MSVKLPYLSILYRFPHWATVKSIAGEMSRYKIDGNAISWDKDSCDKPLPMSNHVEMAGLKSSLIFSYRVDKKGEIKRFIYGIFPQLRIYPNNTHSSLGYIFKHVNIVGQEREVASRITFDGTLTTESSIGSIAITRSITAAKDALAVVEKIIVTNRTDKQAACTIVVPKRRGEVRAIYCHENRPFVMYTYLQGGASDSRENVVLNAHESKEYYAVYAAESDNIDGKLQYDGRINFIADIANKINISTPNQVINQMLQFTKLRAVESIFETKGGLMHAPGGGGFYAAMWTNDQCEYANPYFAYAGYDIAKQSAVNSYDWFGRYVRDDKTIVSSIIAGGDGVWQGVGDRGDNAMYVYGLTRYIMTTGDRGLADRFIDILIRAIEFTIGKINEDGVVASDSDELENRFESGSANLSTSAIAYDAILSMSYLLISMDKHVEGARYRNVADKLRDSIESYFGANVEGYDTYRYCKEENALRSWISIPMSVGICDRAEQSTSAIMSDKLRNGNGILTRSGEKTYWDRSALYALRGMFIAGQSDSALRLLVDYSNDRLLGEHVPYPVEAVPEGNGAHLSAESALYQRIFIEGVLGYRPTGLREFQMAVNLPTEWDNISVNNIELCGKLYNISAVREGELCRLEIVGCVGDDIITHCIKAGETVKIKL